MKLRLLNNIREKFKKEDGQSAVIIVIAFTVLMGLVGLGVDLGIQYTAKQKAQSASDLAALAGAEYLPENVAKARTVATDYAAENGFSKPGEVRIDVLDSDTKLRVTINRTKKTLFAGLMGIRNVKVKCTATAGVEATPAVKKRINPFFDYLLFHSGTTGKLELGTSGLNVYGGIHSNSDVFINSCDKLGSVSTVGSFDGNVPYDLYKPVDVENDKYDYIGRVNKSWWPVVGYMLNGTDIKETDYYSKAPAAIEVPSFIKESAMEIIPTDAAGNPKMPTSSKISLNKGNMYNGSRTINGDVVINGNAELGCNTGMLTINGNVYCTGNLKLQRITINGNVFCNGDLTSSGENITFNGDYVYADGFHPGNGINVAGIVVVNHDMRTTGNVNQLDGGVAILSLNGNIALTAGGQKLNGIVYAPNGSVQFGGGTVVHGNIIAKDLQVRSALTIYPMKQSTADDLGSIVTGGSSSSTPSEGKKIRLLS